MNIIVDENIPRRTVVALRSLGHTVVDIRGTDEEGASDQHVWQLAVAQRALLITTDKGFAQRRSAPHWGALIIRLRQPNSMRIHDRVLYALRTIPQADWPGLLVVVRDTVQSRLRVASGNQDVEG